MLANVCAKSSPRAEERRAAITPRPSRFTAAHATICTACHGVFATPKPSGREHGMRHERRPPFALGDVAEREPEPLALDTHDNQAEAQPVVEPTGDWTKVQ